MRDVRTRLRQPRSWEDRVGYMEQLAHTPAFEQLREDILGLARLNADDLVLDIGAGTGLLTLAAAAQVRHVWALDISPAMCSHLQDKLTAASTTNVETSVANATRLPFATGSVDVVLSNYCLHHLRDADKRRALDEAWRVLRPGGRIVIGDMMFRIALGSARDRTVLSHLMLSMARRGPAGILRLVKNAARSLVGRGEHPASAAWWRQALDAAGFAEVTVRELNHEGGIASARRS